MNVIGTFMCDVLNVSENAGHRHLRGGHSGTETTRVRGMFLSSAGQTRAVRELGCTEQPTSDRLLTPIYSRHRISSLVQLQNSECEARTRW